MSYREAFPDFTPEQLPPIPACWADQSWRQDMCPRFLTARGLTVWVDFDLPENREHPYGPRYIVCTYTPRGADTHLETDDWGAVLAFCRGYDGPAYAAAYLPAMFAAQIATDLAALHPGMGAAWFEALRTENQSEPFKGGPVCASHNYLDANESMLAAFFACMGRVLDVANAGDMDAAQAAWTQARLQGLI